MLRNILKESLKGSMKKAPNSALNRMNKDRRFEVVTRLSVVAGLLFVAQSGRAQQGNKPALPATPPAASGTSATSAGPKTGTAGTASTASAATMQLRREITGNFLCRFVTGGDESAPLVPLPAPLGTDNIVAVPIPSTIKAKDAQLEVVDPDHSRVARLPVVASGVTPLNESSFKFVQSVLVPVQVKGKGGLTAATVTLAAEDKSYKKSVTLTNADAGTAKFADVPLNKAVTVTVQEGANAPVSSTQTLTTPTTADGYKWNVIEVSWPDARAVPLPATTAASAGATPGTISGTSAPPLPTTPYPTTGAPTAQNMPNNTENPLSGIVSTVVSLLFLGGVGYGLYWAYQNGHLKNLLDKLGIQTQPVAAGGPQSSPFDRPQKTPVQPITEGTADPLTGGGNFAGSGAAGFGATPVASAGPRLVGTMGAYAGSIFPLNGTALDIGRDAGNPIALPGDTNASRKHATVQFTGGQATVTDNGSSNGTFVNGVRIAAQAPHPLRVGDEVQIGMTRFRFEQ
jgi:pSer/pThr/pTyr-binding forkhead associated (FHA) protein